MDLEVALFEAQPSFGTFPFFGKIIGVSEIPWSPFFGSLFLRDKKGD